MVRSVGAIIAGYLVFALSAMAAAVVASLVHWTPEQSATPLSMTLVIIYGAVFGALSGWVTGRIAGYNETAHSILLWLVITVATLSTFLFSTTFRWSLLLTMFVSAPMAVVGGVVRERQRKRLGA